MRKWVYGTFWHSFDVKINFEETFTQFVDKNASSGSCREGKSTKGGSGCSQWMILHPTIELFSMLSYEGCGARLRNCKRESSSRAASRKALTHFRWLSNRPLDPSWWCLWYWWNLDLRWKYFFGEVPRWWYWWYSAGKVPSQSGRVGQDEKKRKSWCCQGRVDIPEEQKIWKYQKLWNISQLPFPGWGSLAEASFQASRG